MVMFLITLWPVMASEIMHDLRNHHGHLLKGPQEFFMPSPLLVSDGGAGLPR